jgi:hypothetical protein
VICTIKKYYSGWILVQIIKNTANALRKHLCVFPYIAPGNTAPTTGQYGKEHKIRTYGGLYWKDTLALFLQYGALSKHNSETSFLTAITHVSFLYSYILYLQDHYYILAALLHMEQRQWKKISWQNPRPSSKTQCRSNKLMKQVTRNYH